MAMQGTLLVTPEQLRSTANAFQSNMTSVQRATNQMLDLVSQSSRYWEGEASSSYRNKFNQLRDDIDKIHRMIREHVDDLNEMARVYQAAEDANKATSSRLSGDVI